MSGAVVTGLCVVGVVVVVLLLLALMRAAGGMDDKMGLE